MTTSSRGLTRDPARGFNALAAAAGEITPPGLSGWDKQPLEDLASAPSGHFAARYHTLAQLQ